MATAIVSLVWGCKSPNQSSSDSRPIVAVTIAPQKYFVQKIAGESVSVYTLVPQKASPETYDVSEANLKELARAAVWLQSGRLPFERKWNDKIRMNNTSLFVFDTSVQAEWIGEQADSNPYIWMSPAEAKKIAVEVFRALAAIFPSERKKFIENLNVFMDELIRLDAELRSTMAGTGTEKQVVAAPSLAYFLRDCNPGVQPVLQTSDAQKSKHSVTVTNKTGSSTGRHEIAYNPFSEKWEEQLRTIAQKIAAH
ncbi:MAG: zinc ABC transporter substrate-binding protein [Bacteroidales bacterium]|nr:zinc ABC transporter substrate-binding protein [Bacteroidales bacterium]